MLEKPCNLTYLLFSVVSEAFWADHQGQLVTGPAAAGPGQVRAALRPPDGRGLRGVRISAGRPLSGGVQQE